MARDFTIEDLRTSAKRAGLDLSDEELQLLLPGVNRSKRQAAELREMIAPTDEPAAKFNAPGTVRK